ncbi:MAG: agmatine deiminase [Anaerolineales bacterium]|nr:agmatine deiminase [Anaerolineales bacterium]
MHTLTTTPRQDNYHMPAEYEPHRGCWMLWPERSDNWRLGAKPAQHAFAAVASAIVQFEPVTVGVSKSQFVNARRLLPGEVRVVELSCNDSWVRDTGPTFVVNDRGDLRGVDWDFNAWGGLDSGIYFTWDQDALVALKILEIERIDRYKACLVMEGGSFHNDGQGTLRVTEECLLNLNRNPHLSKEDIEDKLREYLNVVKIIWLGRGVFGDETSGHVDNLCCFVRPGVVALTWTDDQSDPQYQISLDAYQRLSEAANARGRKLEIFKIHQPGPFYITQEESQGVDVVESSAARRKGDRLTASYINFYLPNGGVVVPTFDDPWDAPALETLALLFPDRQVVPLPAREILLGGGNIHCITQQIPAGKTA